MEKSRIYVTDPRLNSYRNSTLPAQDGFLSFNWETAQPKVNYFGHFHPISGNPLPPPPQIVPNAATGYAYIGNDQTGNGLLGEFLFPAVTGGKVPNVNVIPSPQVLMSSPQDSNPTTNTQISDESYTMKRKAISMGKVEEESSMSPQLSNDHKKVKKKQFFFVFFNTEMGWTGVIKFRNIGMKDKFTINVFLIKSKFGADNIPL